MGTFLTKHCIRHADSFKSKPLDLTSFCEGNCLGARWISSLRLEKEDRKTDNSKVSKTAERPNEPSSVVRPSYGDGIEQSKALTQL